VIPERNARKKEDVWGYLIYRGAERELKGMWGSEGCVDICIFKSATALQDNVFSTLRQKQIKVQSRS
jgi:hypothetical protein